MDLVKNPGPRVVISLEIPGSGDGTALDADVVADRGSPRGGGGVGSSSEGDAVPDLAFILVTVAAFGLLAVIVRAVEKL
jgi:hypothetical protein